MRTRSLLLLALLAACIAPAAPPPKSPPASALVIAPVAPVAPAVPLPLHQMIDPLLGELTMGDLIIGTDLAMAKRGAKDWQLGTSTAKRSALEARYTPRVTVVAYPDAVTYDCAEQQVPAASSRPRWFVIPRTELPIVGAPVNVLVPCATPPDDPAITAAQPAVPDRLEVTRMPWVVTSHDELARLVDPLPAWAGEIDFARSMIVVVTDDRVTDRVTVYPPLRDVQRPRPAHVKDGVIAFAQLPLPAQRCWAIPPTRDPELAKRRADRPIAQTEMAWGASFDDTSLERAAGRYTLEQAADWLVLRGELVEAPERRCQERLATRVLTSRKQTPWLDGADEQWDDRKFNLVVFVKTQPYALREPLAVKKQGGAWTIDVPVPVLQGGGCCEHHDCFMHGPKTEEAPIAQFDDTFAAGYLVPKSVAGVVRAMFQPVDKSEDCSHHPRD